jgi:hypothetical protein
MLDEGVHATLVDLAKAKGVHATYVSRILRLTLLAALVALHVLDILNEHILMSTFA